jgi:hypothetical protein
LSAPSKTERPTETIRERHDRLRIRVPDPNAVSFAAEAHRQSAAVAARAQSNDDQDFIDAVSRGDDA